MKPVTQCTQVPSGHDVFRHAFLILLISLLAAGCSGSSGDIAAPVSSAQCDPADAATHDECGTLLVGLTDADGDFLNYTVDVVKLTLETANGRIVETLPRSTRIDFTDYVDVTELVSAATVPPATYVAGSITLDYGGAEIHVEVDGEAVEGIVTDAAGNPLGEASLDVVLSDRDRLVVTRGRPALLQLDFDLAASHRVDIATRPVTAVAEPFIVAEVTPVDEKDLRARGPLVDVDEQASSYIVALRPFHDRAGDFGRVPVNTADDTEFEIDGELYTGSDGLAALAAAGRGTPTVAAGTLDVEAREFHARLVLAGSSVPGAGSDAVIGNVIARDGNLLTVRGATIVPAERPAHFHDDVVVEVGPETKVFKLGQGAETLDVDAISVGQRVSIRGALPDTGSTETDAPEILLFDATAGAVRLHLTRVSGVVNQAVAGEIEITLHAIDGRRAAVFDFAGTGPSADLDADPGAYQIATGPLATGGNATGRPVVAKGFPTAFGAAPPDFDGRSLVDFTDVRSTLGIGWSDEGTIAPFVSAGPDGLLLDNYNASIGTRKYVKQGPVLVDLTGLDSYTLVEPIENGRTLYALKSGDSLRLYSSYSDFVDDLSESLDGATAVRSMYAHGTYDAATNVFSASKIGIHLLEP
jgi:hypothetical protein